MRAMAGLKSCPTSTRRPYRSRGRTKEGVNKSRSTQKPQSPQRKSPGFSARSASSAFNVVFFKVLPYEYRPRLSLVGQGFSPASCMPHPLVGQGFSPAFRVIHEQSASVRGSRNHRLHSSIKFATRAVHPVWWLAPSPAPLSPWKYSLNSRQSRQNGSV
jgi:hypothetical protein